MLPFAFLFGEFCSRNPNLKKQDGQGWKPGVCHWKAGKPSDPGAGPHEVWRHLWCYQDVLGLHSARKEGRV